MVNKLMKYIKNERAIYIMFSIYIITIIIPETSLSILEKTFDSIIRVIRYGCYLFFITKIFWDWKNRRNKITVTMTVISILSIIIFMFSKSKNFLFLSMLLLALRGTDKEKLINIALKTYIVVFFIVIMAGMLNIIPDWTYLSGKIMRHSLGFSYPTITIGYYLMLVMMYTYTRKNKITIYEVIVLEAINVFLYKYTFGKTSFILITAILLFMLLKKITVFNNLFKRDSFEKILKVCCYMLPTILLILILVLTFLYGTNNEFAQYLSRVLSNRIQLSYQGFQEYSVTLFGQKTQWNGWGGVGYSPNIDASNYRYNYVDNSYTRLILDYGIVTTILVICAYTTMLVQNYNKKDYWTIFCIFIILILAEIEPCLVDYNRNIFVILFISLLDYKPIKELEYENVKRIIENNMQKLSQKLKG